MTVYYNSGEALEQRVMSAKELAAKAREFDWNPAIPFKYWVRAADAIYKEGKIHLRDGNVSNAYLYLMRYSELLVDKLARHPRAKDPESKKAFKPLMSRLPDVMAQLEQLQPSIDRHYQEWVKVTAAQRDTPTQVSGYAKHASNDPALSWNTTSPVKVLNAGDHRDLAVDLARREIRRRRRDAGLADDNEKRQREGGIWDRWDAVDEGERLDDQDLPTQMAATRRRLEESDPYATKRSSEQSRTTRTNDESSSFSSTHYRYPSINKSQPLQYERQASPGRTSALTPRPARPPKEHIRPPSPPRYQSVGPELPRKIALDHLALSRSSTPDSPVAPALPPKAAPTAEQDRVTFRPAAYLEDGRALRTMFLPSTLRQTFLRIAAENTRRSLEMCGILCGTVVNNALFVSCLLIPEQKCTPDTCETENESAMLDYCMNEDLLVLGWIHTHPTQTCFMSSRDLHTQAGYQVMMPESIAIVCAPRSEPSFGIFRLTDPPGLPYILKCQHSDTFHQHSIDNIYTDAENPEGHVYETSKLDFTVHDLRPKA